MSADILIDYLGTGEYHSLYHPSLKVSNLIGRIEVPQFNIVRDNPLITWDFTLPEVINNPFLMLTGISDVDYFFTPIDQVTGKWRLSLIGRFQSQRSGTTETTRAMFTNPATSNVTRNYTKTYVIYGGNRG